MSESSFNRSHLLVLLFVASPCRGLIPRLLGDIISLWLCNSLAYLVNTYALDSGVGWDPDEITLVLAPQCPPGSSVSFTVRWPLVK